MKKIKITSYLLLSVLGMCIASSGRALSNYTNNPVARGSPLWGNYPMTTKEIRTSKE